MSLYCGLQYSGDKYGLGAVLCLSGYLPNASEWKMSSLGYSTPFAMFHGSRDQVVRLPWAKKSYDKIITDVMIVSGNECNKDKTLRIFKEYDDLEHNANEDEMEDLVDFLRKNVADLAEK